MNNTKLNGFLLMGCVLYIGINTAVHAGTMGSELTVAQSKLYFGAFGGGGSMTSSHLSQQGTAFFSESSGGPLAVNAIGESKSASAWVVGGHAGYQWPAKLLNHGDATWRFSPATELEGYYLGGAATHGEEVNNDTTRLAEHYFHVAYPKHAGVFLVNALLNINHSQLGQFKPYVGVGVGTAVISVSGANSTQTMPQELGVNHYNSGSSDTSTAFAAQPKIGVSFNLNQHTTMLLEYRFLYLSATDYTFGSTVYSTHVPTSNWDVKIGAQYYNMGTMGIQYDL